jgi:SAM-dependent methyltransferase
MRLHLGCGTTYLKNYINVDIAPDYLIDDAPPAVLMQNTTIFERYYKHEFCKGSGLCVADIKASIDCLPFHSKTIDEAILIHVLEHIQSYEVGKVLKEISRVLKVGGSFIVGVPDLKETARMLAETKTPEQEDWCIRLIHGTQRNEWSHHFCGYTERTLKEILSLYGFIDFETLPNINFYPAIHLKAYKGEANEA